MNCYITSYASYYSNGNIGYDCRKVIANGRRNIICSFLLISKDTRFCQKASIPLRLDSRQTMEKMTVVFGSEPLSQWLNNAQTRSEMLLPLYLFIKRKITGHSLNRNGNLFYFYYSHQRELNILYVKSVTFYLVISKSLVPRLITQRRTVHPTVTG